jgi:hypothetical protein
VLYRLRRQPGASGGVLTAILDAVRNDVAMRTERDRAAERSRSNIQSRIESPPAYRTMLRAKSPS